MLDLQSDERLISLAEAAKLLPPARSGRPVHISTLIRGIVHGCNGARLEAVRSGARWLTTREAVARWLEAQTRASLGEPSTPPRTPASRSRAATRAERQLIDAGL